VGDREFPLDQLWIDERLVVALSAIEGSGLFFTEDLPVGTVVVRLGGRVVSSVELDDLIRRAETTPGADYVDTITLDDDAHLVLPSGTAVHFGNHSCDPTLWFVAPAELVTRQAVTASQEATIDYGTVSGADGFTMECRCGSTACRGQVTSDDWKQPELQARYRGHWVPALRKRIDGVRDRDEG